jgi:hypothetical protein
LRFWISDFGFWIEEQALWSIPAIQNRKSKIGSGGFDDFAGLQAARADANALGATADERAHRLQVRVKAAVRAVIRVRNAMTELRSLAADIAPF